MNIYETNEELRDLSSHNSTKVFECRKMGSAKNVGRALDKKRPYNSCSEGEVPLRMYIKFYFTGLSRLKKKERKS